MRVYPIFYWTYDIVWLFLRRCDIPYCKLYNEGYTSLGQTDNTVPNLALLKREGTGFLPAYELVDNALERSGSREPLSIKSQKLLAPVHAIPTDPGPVFSSNAAFVVIDANRTIFCDESCNDVISKDCFKKEDESQSLHRFLPLAAAIDPVIIVEAFSCIVNHHAEPSSLGNPKLKTNRLNLRNLLTQLRDEHFNGGVVLVLRPERDLATKQSNSADVATEMFLKDNKTSNLVRRLEALYSEIFSIRVSDMKMSVGADNMIYLSV
jgi:3'-phosphoadenosine 5'-phosphosulfate sulfotransferase (PAPS reductase)/FAD synthetase